MLYFCYVRISNKIVLHYAHDASFDRVFVTRPDTAIGSDCRGFNRAAASPARISSRPYWVHLNLPPKHPVSPTAPPPHRSPSLLTQTPVNLPPPRSIGLPALDPAIWRRRVLRSYDDRRCWNRGSLFALVNVFNHEKIFSVPP